RRMAELMLSLEDELELDFAPHALDGSRPTLNVGVVVSGGVYFGVVPGLAEFGCDLRTLPGMTEASVRAALERWLDRRRAVWPERVRGARERARGRADLRPRRRSLLRAAARPTSAGRSRGERSLMEQVGVSALQAVAVNLQKWRLSRGISVSALARAADVSKS